MTRVYNFSAGPSTLPESVLEQAQNELLDFHGLGMSVMELSHRSREFIDVAEKTQTDIRTLLAIPNDYHILFLQGGARAQFAFVPLNLMTGSDQGFTADYVDSGYWANSAMAEARRYCAVNTVASVDDSDGTKRIKHSKYWQLSEQAAYLHLTSNETIDGIHCISSSDEADNTSQLDFLRQLPRPIIADMSSVLLSQPINVSQYDLIYAGAQKNIGPAGLTLVIIHERLLLDGHPLLPSVFNYKQQVKAQSMVNTPPTFAWYMAGLTVQWLLQRGGLAQQAKVNQKKAALLYHTIDTNEFYHNNVATQNRSLMNIPFALANPELDGVFLEQAEQQGLCHLKGHRAIGGMRASLYNALPLEAVESLCVFMESFAKNYG